MKGVNCMHPLLRRRLLMFVALPTFVCISLGAMLMVMYLKLLPVAHGKCTVQKEGAMVGCVQHGGGVANPVFVTTIKGTTLVADDTGETHRCSEYRVGEPCDDDGAAKLFETMKTGEPTTCVIMGEDVCMIEKEDYKPHEKGLLVWQIMWACFGAGYLAYLVWACRYMLRLARHVSSEAAKSIDPMTLGIS
eukprot:TRINITY_DN93617_c0_g1_i1.p1 TRINITY_DN93617_c0_g1~~TRINITY_DN93617_c0_g1_i1.p1  ORF type:complete len:191 (+),score=19.23 TRINITY_DN93617_c0_g1_i1:84-656(+)